MRMYVCLSCLQVKHGDSHRVDMNICETCSSDLSTIEEDPQLCSSPPSLCIINEMTVQNEDYSDNDESSSAFC